MLKIIVGILCFLPFIAGGITLIGLLLGYLRDKPGITKIEIEINSDIDKDEKED